MLSMECMELEACSKILGPGLCNQSGNFKPIDCIT